MTTDRPAARPDPEAVADELLNAFGEERPLAPFTDRIAGFDLAFAYTAAAAVRRRRQSRGERLVGRKIGFTNRTIWETYGVEAPMWGDMYDTTVHDIADLGDGFDIAGMMEPRIEPEIAFGLKRAPSPGMDEAALLAAIDWVAHGFEIVQSPFPDWQFVVADTVAAGGLHGACLLGPRHAIDADDAGQWLDALARFEIALSRDGEQVDTGNAANVLGGPLSALRHLVELLADDPASPALGAGEIVTTGTLTGAFPIAPGERWQTTLRGISLDGIEVRIV